MRVGVHLQALRPGEIGGLEDYVHRLLGSLIELDRGLDFVLFCADYNAGSLAALGCKETHVLSATEFGDLDARRLGTHDLDLWFCPLLVLEPPSPSLPSVVTVPDLQHAAYPDFFTPEILAWRRRHYARTAERADRILTFSEYSRRQIVEVLGADPSRVTATYLAGTLAGGADSGEVRARHDLPAEYFFYPGAAWPHKNHQVLFEALARLHRHTGAAPSLVLTGARVAGGVDLERAWRELGLGERVRALGFVPKDDMHALYALSLATVLPSLFEGFGIPAVEAMGAGSPVICSSATSLPEVAGDAALYFDPERPDELCDRLASLSPAGGGDGSSRRREELVRAGRRQAETFSWRRTAESTLAVFSDAVADRRRLARDAVEVGQVAAGDAPLITVVTPSLDQQAFIERTVRSVLDQDHDRVEHLIIDGGSADGTVDVLRRCREADPNRFDFVSEADRGQAHAVNKGFARARGEIVGWLNSDDVYEPGALAAVAAAFAEHPEWDVLYGRAHYVDEAGDLLGVYPTRAPFDWQTLAHECFICQPTVFCRRRVIDELGFRLDESLQMCMDYDFWIRLGRELEVGFLDRVLASSRMYRDNKTISRRSDVYREIFSTVTQHYGRLPFSWALGRAHHVWDHGDPFFNIRRLTGATYLIAGFFLIRHNWASPRYWPHLWREVRVPLAAKLSRHWRALLARDPAT